MTDGLFWHGPSLRRLFEAKHKDLARSIPTLKKGHGGKQRAQMPQIDDPSAFVQWLASEKHIPFTLDSVESGSLTPTQKHFSTEKVQEMAKNAMSGKFPKINDPIIVSADLKILDGHHRWAALRAMSPKNPIKVYRVSTTIEKLMSLARQFGAKSENLHKAAASVFKYAATVDQLQQAYHRVAPMRVPGNFKPAAGGGATISSIGPATVATRAQLPHVVANHVVPARHNLAQEIRHLRNNPGFFRKLTNRVGLTRGMSSGAKATAYQGLSDIGQATEHALLRNSNPGLIMVPRGGAYRNLQQSPFLDLPNLTGAGQRAVNIAAGLHEGFERGVRPLHVSPMAGHMSPTVLMNEHNMVQRMSGPGAAEARSYFQHMRRGGETETLRDMARQVGGNRAVPYVAEHGFTKAMKTRIKRQLAAQARTDQPKNLAATLRTIESGRRAFWKGAD